MAWAVLVEVLCLGRRMGRKPAANPSLQLSTQIALEAVSATTNTGQLWSQQSSPIPMSSAQNDVAGSEDRMEPQA